TASSAPAIALSTGGRAFTGVLPPTSEGDVYRITVSPGDPGGRVGPVLKALPGGDTGRLPGMHGGAPPSVDRPPGRRGVPVPGILGGGGPGDGPGAIRGGPGPRVGRRGHPRGRQCLSPAGPPPRPRAAPRGHRPGSRPGPGGPVRPAAGHPGPSGR